MAEQNLAQVVAQRSKEAGKVEKYFDHAAVNPKTSEIAFKNVAYHAVTQALSWKLRGDDAQMWVRMNGTWKPDTAQNANLETRYKKELQERSENGAKPAKAAKAGQAIRELGVMCKNYQSGTEFRADFITILKAALKEAGIRPDELR